MYNRVIVKSKDQWNPETWQQYQMVYWQLKNLDANRLNVSSWLGGFTLAAFSALTASGNIQLSGLDFGHIIRFFVAVCLVIASLLLLATAYSAYQTIRMVGHLTPTNVKNLEDSHYDAPDALVALEQERKDPGDSDLANSDSERLRQGWHIHEEASGSISWGLTLLGLALIGIATEINIWVVVFAVAGLICISWRSRTMTKSVWESTKRGVRRLRDRL
jgi:hypothetical protein